MSEGIVYLVGAGPGDPGLMTRRSLELIAEADAILYDRLIPADALDGARRGCDLRYVGKEPGNPAMAQEDIDALLVELGSQGLQVVRLKGGDPFVFGRGGEEAEALAAAGVTFEVVPGVTSGVAAPAYAGIAVTHRDAASAVAFVTGHEDPAKEESEKISKDSASLPNPSLDWEALARFPGTLVLYMGVKNLPLISERLVTAGRPADEPAAVIQRGTLPGQTTVIATLADIAQRVAESGIRPPAITVIGRAAALRGTLAWLESRPLHGRRVAVTRARAQASGLAGRLRALGAEVSETPVIRTEPRPVEGEVERMATEIGEYTLVILTSPNGAILLMDALAATGRDARALAGATLAAIGPGTARELERHGIRPDVVPPRSIAESLVEALAGVPVDGRRVLVARAAEARDVLPRALGERGAEVDVVALYDTVAEPLSDAQREALAAADYVTFTSSSTVRFLVEAVGSPDGLPAGARIVSIGPVTSATAHEHGLTVHVEAERHDIDGLLEALVRDAQGAGGTSPE
ncbi:MAG: uroporphyrinogen-III C-methyltransferase [Thermoleophilaceae bacterium]|nr:uroporphyrinogen-III C-methyltransferase [Thermoleophilaceae bacterium]